MIEQGKQPVYTYTLDVSDELSRRVIHADYELIKIDPKVPNTLFLPDSCSAKCDSLIGQLDRTIQLPKGKGIGKRKCKKSNLRLAGWW